MPDQIIGAGANNLVILPNTGEYDPKITAEVDRAIRHLPVVQKYLRDMAKLLQGRAGPNFEVVHGGGPQRSREYVAPANNEGIHEELKDAALLKAAISMRGK